MIHSVKSSFRRAYGLVGTAVLAAALTGCRTPAAMSSSATPCMAQLGTFHRAGCSGDGPCRNRLARRQLDERGHARRSARQWPRPASDALCRREFHQDVSRQRRQGNLDLSDRPGLRIRRRVDAFQRQHSFHSDAIRRRNHAGQKSSLALRLQHQQRRQSHGSPHLPAHRFGSRDVCVERIAARD